MNKKPFRRMLSVLLVFALLAALLPSVPGKKAEAAGDAWEISNFNELVAAAVYSRTALGSSADYVLTADIEITEEDYAKIQNDDVPYISFGSADIPFAGTFDGQGHTISGLTYIEVATKPMADTGLFKQTKGATIKNLTLSDAEIQSDMRGGIVVGYAEDTVIENVRVEKSGLSVAAADNVLLIGSDLGIRGGGIAGETVNSVLYNCEVDNCFIRSNNTSGVAALAGKPLTLGGIVGCAESSAIEYCRVIGDKPYDADAQGGIEKTRISVYYDVVVGAIGGNTLYVGGIAGRIWAGDNNDANKGKPTKIIDCFSTADLYFYCATYVSVLGVNIGHIGGITAEVWDGNCEITRCHYAGTATSKQWNTLLVIPIIETNKNIAGVADIYGGKKDDAYAKVYGAFFKDSLNPDVEMGTLGSVSSNGNFGPWGDTLYTNRSAWETFGFDFSGTEDRSTTLPDGSVETHRNKWVMDYELGIPVHGSSVAATFDFPEAGEVSVAPTDLVGQSVSTTDPYTFAVQGAASSDDSLTLTYTPASEKYRLDGWWRIPGVTDDTAVRAHSYFDGLFKKYETIADVPVYGEEQTQMVINPVSDTDKYIPKNEVGNITEWQDNDLFVARLEARVAFHDYEKKLIDTDGNAQDETTDNDWYYYEAQLPQVVPSNAPESQNAVFIGWTTDDSKEYTAITSAELEKLKNDGQFYETGDAVTEALELYPVYSDLISNIITIFEGHEQDSVANQSVRESVGSTSSWMNDDKTVTISVTGAGTDGAFPDGYRFLGWYDENGYCVSREQEYTLAGIDLTQEHTYTARMEYRVDYMAKCVFSSNSEYNAGKLYASIWHTYKEKFQDIQGPNFFREEFRYWATETYQNTEKVIEVNPEITGSYTAYSCNENTAGGSTHEYDVDGLVDFPGAGKIVMSGTTAIYNIRPSSDDGNALANDRYQFIAWTWGATNSNVVTPRYGTISDYTGGNNPTFTLISTTSYRYTGHFAAEITFHQKDGGVIDSDTALDGNNPYLRRYDTSLFEGDDYTYAYEFTGKPIDNEAMRFTSPAAPSDDSMQKDGYYFVGWVDKDTLTTDEWNYIFDVSGDSCCTSDINKVRPYIIAKDAKVYAPMDLYPVYAKYDYSFTTNLKEVGFKGNDAVNVPKLPVESSFKETGDGMAEVTFTVDSDTPVAAGTSEPLYTVVSVECVNLTTGVRENMTANSDGTYTGVIQAGYTYQFIANYEPVAVVYHKGGDAQGKDELETVVRNTGDRLGEAPEPLNTQDVVGANYVFAGWTQVEPEQGVFHIAEYSSMPTLTSENTPVTGPMELWPVYTGVSLNVNSNIDSKSGVVSDDIRGFEVSSINQQEVRLWAEQSVITDSANYAFTGWYTGYVGEGNPGTLVSADTETELSGDEIFAGETYTAVYEIVYTVNYHDTEGNIIYTAYASQSNPRSFVQTQIVTKPNGQGGMISEEVESIIDTDAFTKITETVPVNEQFLEWQWVKADGSSSGWDEFYKTEITSNMELYPVTNSIDVIDTAGNELTYMNPDTLQGDISLGLRQDEETKESIVSVLLRTEYMQPFIETVISKIAYNGTDDPVTEEIAEQKVSLYVAHSAPEVDGSVDDVSLCDTKTTEQQASGRILAHFDLFGQLTLTKRLADSSTADSGDIFLFEVTADGITRTVPLEAGESVTITDIPYGAAYTVSEDADWSWRYEGTTEGAANGAISNYNEAASVIFVNRKTNENWFSGSDYISNEFNADSGTGGN